MSDKFDELAKGLAQSVTRRGVLKKFGVGLAGIALVSLGLVKKAEARPGKHHYHCNCHKAYRGCDPADIACLQFCIGNCAP